MCHRDRSTLTHATQCAPHVCDCRQQRLCRAHATAYHISSSATTATPPLPARALDTACTACTAAACTQAVCGSAAAIAGSACMSGVWFVLGGKQQCLQLCCIRQHRRGAGRLRKSHGCGCVCAPSVRSKMLCGGERRHTVLLLLLFRQPCSMKSIIPAARGEMI